MSISWANRELLSGCFAYVGESKIIKTPINNCRWYLKRGYTYKWFFQRWLWGEKNLERGHWSYNYQKKIFKNKSN